MNQDRSSRSYVTIEEVYRRYGYDLLRFLHGSHPHLNHQDCEDLLHEAVLKAVSRIEQYDPQRGSLRLWVFGILRNEARMDLRRRASRPPSSQPELEGVAADEPGGLERAAARDEQRALDQALLALPFAEREALLARVRTEGLASDEEVARRLGLAPGSLAVYRQRARAKLRALLAEPAGAGETGGTPAWSTRTRNRIRS